jgi:hypothetical protein
MEGASMADYIKTDILFQAYVHIDTEYDEETENEDNGAREYLANYIEARAKHFLDPSVSTTLQFKSGSLKAYATVRGALSACLPPAYTDFVTAINQLFWFTKRLSDAAVMELTFKTNSYLAAIERTEARPGIIGRTKHVLDEFRDLASHFHDRDRVVLTRKIRRLQVGVRRVLESVSNKDDLNLLKTEFRKQLRFVPSQIAHDQVRRRGEAIDFETYRVGLAKLVRNG